MKFGVNIPNFDTHVTPQVLQGWARLAEDLGYHAAMISDHVAITPDVQAEYPAPFYDPFTTLSWLAGTTDAIELGTTVTVLPYRNPLLTARVAANIDQFSGGRFILGIGGGWARQEYAVLGASFERRGAVIDEYLATIRELWTQDVASFDGEFVSFSDVHTGPRPARSPHPPVWVGGSSPAAIRRTVRYGDAWHPLHARLDWLRGEGLSRLRSAAETAGRPVPAFSPRIALRLTDTALGEDRLPGQGTLDQVRADLTELESLGADYVVLDTDPGSPEGRRPPEDDWRTLETLAEHVLDLKGR